MNTKNNAETQEEKELNEKMKQIGFETGSSIRKALEGLPDMTKEDFDEILIHSLKVSDEITSLNEAELKAKIGQLDPLPIEMTGHIIRSLYHDEEAPEKILEGTKYDQWIGLVLTLHFGQFVQVITQLTGETEPRGKWSKLKQGPVANELLKVVSKGKKTADKNTVVDVVGGFARTIGDNIAITMPLGSYEKDGGLAISTHRLFDYMMQTWTGSRHGQGGFDINFPLREYWEEFEISPSGSARHQVGKDLTILASPIHYRWSDKQGQREQMDLNIFEFTGIKNGRVIAKLTQTAKDLYKNYSVMPFHLDTWKFNIRQYPHASYFVRRIQLHKHMNRNKSNENIIRVKTLLDAAPLMPTYADVGKGGRQFRQRIIDPFERNLNALETLGIEWGYTRPGQEAEPLEKDELSRLGYLEWENLLIAIKWDYYPVQKQLEIAEITEAKTDPENAEKEKKEVTEKEGKNKNKEVRMSK